MRLFHWSNAALVVATCAWLEGGETPHAWAGYAIGALLLARIVWGFTGSQPARFASFFPTPVRLRAYLADFPAGLRKPQRSNDNHNPLGALMILLMLVLLATAVISGWMQTTGRWWGEAWVQELHECASHVLLIAAGVHVAAVLLMQRISGVALVRAMLCGVREKRKSSNLDKHR